MSKVKYKSVILLMLGWFSLTTLQAQELLTLQEAVKIALEQNYAIRIQKNQEQIAKENVTLGNAGFLPTVNAVANQTQSVSNTNQKFSNGSEQNRRNATNTTLNSGVTATWILFDGMRMFVTYKRLQALSEVEYLNLKEKAQQTVLDVNKLYANAVTQKQLLKSYEQSMKLYQQYIDILKLRVEVGTAAQFDLLQAEVNFNELKSLALNQQSTFEISKVQLNELLARPVATTFDVVDSLSYKSSLSKESIDLSKNNAVLLADRNKVIASYATRIAQGGILPVIGLTGGYNYLKVNSQAGFVLFNQTRGYNYGISATWNLFNGFNQHRQIQVSKLAAINAEVQYQQTVLQVDSRLAQLYRNYELNARLLELEQRNVKAAQRLADLAVEKFQIGTISTIQVIDAQRSHINAQLRHINALNKLKIAELDLLKLDGKIIEEK